MHIQACRQPAFCCYCAVYPPQVIVIDCLLDEGLGNSKIYLLVYDSLRTDWIRALIARSVRYIRNGRISLKSSVYGIATFLVIQACLKISAVSFNSSNEARGTADVPNEDDDRVLDGNTLPDDIPAPEDSHTCNVKKCHLTEIVTDFTILKLILVNPATKAVSERSFPTARSLIENLALFKHESN